MRAGMLRDRIRIEQPRRTKSATGASSTTWVAVLECAAEIRTQSSGQQVVSDQARSQNTHQIRIRHFAGVDYSCRIIAISRSPHVHYAIVGVADPDGRRRETVIDVVEASKSDLP